MTKSKRYLFESDLEHQTWIKERQTNGGRKGGQAKVNTKGFGTHKDKASFYGRKNKK